VKLSLAFDPAKYLDETLAAWLFSIIFESYPFNPETGLVFATTLPFRRPSFGD